MDSTLKLLQNISLKTVLELNHKNGHSDTITKPMPLEFQWWEIVCGNTRDFDQIQDQLQGTSAEDKDLLVRLVSKGLARDPKKVQPGMRKWAKNFQVPETVQAMSVMPLPTISETKSTHENGTVGCAKTKVSYQHTHLREPNFN